MNRITWEGDQAKMTGYIYGEAEKYKAKIAVFSIRYSVHPADRQAGTPYLLAHRLPFRGIERKFGSFKEAQAHAERYLVWAFRLMGFVPDNKDGEDV